MMINNPIIGAQKNVLIMGSSISKNSGWVTRLKEIDESIVAENLSVAGANSGYGKSISSQIKWENYQYAVIEYYANDASILKTPKPWLISNQISEIVNSARRRNSTICIVVLIPSPFYGAKSLPRIPLNKYVSSKYKEIVNELNLVLIDARDKWQELGEIFIKENIQDGLHPNTHKSSLLIAQEVIRRLPHCR